MSLCHAPRAAPRALPRRFRRPRLLVLGCGDVGLRLLRQLAPRLRAPLGAVAVTRRPEQQAAARALGARAIAADLDDRRSLRRLAAFTGWMIDLAPPPASGVTTTKLESYVDEKFQVAQVLCDIEGPPDDRLVKLALEELAFFAEEVRMLGTYAAHPFRLKKK